MDISVTANPSGRTAYINTQTTAAQAEKKADAPVPANPQDVIEISPEARAAMAKQAAQADSAVPVDAVSEETDGNNAVTTFTSFAEEFNKVTEGYSDIIREHYAKEHAENLTYDNPSNHIWNKYKNPDSPDFRADLSEDERAWAYDQELDLLNGGKHLQMRNPYAFPDGAPTLSSAAMQANQACREQIDQSIQDLFAKNGIEVPAGASFRLTVDQSYSIHVTGLEDKELTAAMEQALNCGGNGKNLYNHLKLTSPDSNTPGVDYADGHLPAVDTQQELDDSTLAEVKKQTCPTYSQFSTAYNPHQGALNDGFIGLDPNSPFNTKEAMDRSNASVRVYGPEIIARFRAGELFPGQQKLVVNHDREVDPDYSISAKTYLRAYVQPALDAKKTIEAYYADAHRENSAYQPFIEGVHHIEDKYKNASSPFFRADLPEAQRNMAYLQEMSLLTTGSISTLGDPYALASVGGIRTYQSSHEIAMQAVREKLDELLRNME